MLRDAWLHNEKPYQFGRIMLVSTCVSLDMISPFKQLSIPGYNLAATCLSPCLTKLYANALEWRDYVRVVKKKNGRIMSIHRTITNYNHYSAIKIIFNRKHSDLNSIGTIIHAWLGFFQF